MRNHQLDQIAQAVNLRISQEDDITLKMLSEYILWKGRYHLTTSEKHYPNYYPSEGVMNNLVEEQFRFKNVPLLINKLQEQFKKV